MAGSVTALARLGIGAADPVDLPLNFSAFDPGVKRELKDFNGTRGTLFQDGNRVLENRRTITPKYASEPTATEWGYLLPWIMSGTPTGTTTKTYPWANTPAERYVHFKPNAGEQWFLSNCAVNQATIRASSGEALSCDLDLLARFHNATRTDMPTLSYDQTLQPFLLSDLVLLVGGVDRKPREFSINIVCGLDPTRYLNSLNLTALQKLGSAFNVSVDVPSGDNAAQFWASGIVGASLSATFTNATTSSVLTITIADLRFPGDSPTHPAGGEGFLRITGQACRVGTADPIAITLTV